MVSIQQQMKMSFDGNLKIKVMNAAELSSSCQAVKKKKEKCVSHSVICSEDSGADCAKRSLHTIIYIYMCVNRQPSVIH